MNWKSGGEGAEGGYGVGREGRLVPYLLVFSAYDVSCRNRFAPRSSESTNTARCALSHAAQHYSNLEHEHTHTCAQTQEADLQGQHHFQHSATPLMQHCTFTASTEMKVSRDEEATCQASCGGISLYTRQQRLLSVGNKPTQN